MGRNILGYSRIREMEKEIEQTKIILKGYESSADSWKARTEELQSQLAEKEKEIGELKCRKEELKKIVFEIGKWVVEGNAICNELQKTRFAFKSTKVKELREKLEKIFSEMTIMATNTLRPLINPREWNPQEQKSYDIY